MKNLNFVQLVCVSFDQPCSMMAVHHAFLASSDRKPGTNN